MTDGRIEVITSVQRRRRWSQEEKERLVAASLEPGAVSSAIAREAGIHVSQLFRWRKELCERQPAVPAFAAVAVAAPAASGTIEIELVNGTRVRITGSMDGATLSATLGALAAAKRRS
jgi:transposase